MRTKNSRFHNRCDKILKKNHMRTCVNCGSNDIGINHNFFGGYWCECNSCHWSTLEKRTICGTIKHWNKRMIAILIERSL